MAHGGCEKRGMQSYSACQPLFPMYQIRDMQLQAADHDLDALTCEGTLDDIRELPSDARRAVLQKYLVTREPILMQEPTGWSNEESIKRFILLRELLKEDKCRQSLLLEARRVFYEDNSFIVSFEDFSRFLDDMLGSWEDAAAVETLVRDLKVRVRRDDCQCGQLMKYMRHTSYFCAMPQLRTITFEWSDSLEDATGNDGDVTSSDESYWNDDRTDDSEESSDTLRWESSDDDSSWSLDEGVEG
ncbi:uncharacterized protein FIESC28_11616 [Fusarium coffeatum]|uniref:Uncharacterized protein n=1 Tax=Fusarium coffeatum TaxID=231269 RepID=A0A366QH58_9HYPO|nr:uncharacterized protein FIESC28_11616 [Fusarium coffeatum]RBR04167.1 hypothetical protein FIESC28_11616 [Fusarium coffeatum]